MTNKQILKNLGLYIVTQPIRAYISHRNNPKNGITRLWDSATATAASVFLFTGTIIALFVIFLLLRGWAFSVKVIWEIAQIYVLGLLATHLFYYLILMPISKAAVWTWHELCNLTQIRYRRKTPHHKQRYIIPPTSGWYTLKTFFTTELTCAHHEIVHSTEFICIPRIHGWGDDAPF